MRAILLSICIGVTMGQAAATTWYVDDSVASSGAGKTWATAFKTIQEGINAASDGDRVIVSQGTYVENIHLKGKNIVLTSTGKSQSVIANTIIDGNQAGSAVTLAGTEDPTCLLYGFTIRNGRADYGGGIIGGEHYPDWSRATIQYNIIVGNRANVDGGGLINCAGTIRNNRITGNSAAEYGGGLCKCFGAIHNNTITGNSAGVGGGGMDSCSGTIQNCIVWGNTAPDEAQIYPGSTPTYSCIQSWSRGGEGNIALDPQFVDPAVGNYRLLGGSPCIDAGKNESWMTFFGADLGGNPRIVNGTVDMGAYEWSPKTWYVDGEVVVSGNGTSWATAFKTIQEGIDASWDGETVMVHPSTYPENIHFRGKNICVTGYHTDEPPFRPWIDGRDRGPCVTFAGTESQTCVLRGFFISNGKADYGGGICGGDDENHTHATIVENTIASSLARQSGGGIAYCDGLIADNTIRGSHADYRGGGLYRCDGTIQNNSIFFNSSGNDGGGLSECFATIENNWIGRNEAERHGGGLAGCPYPIQNNMIAENSAASGGGGLYGCRGKVRNNTIRDNTSGAWSGGLDMCDGTILNCIIWGNTSPTGLQLYAGSTPTYSCIQDWSEGGEGNIALDPQFVDPANQDYHLSSGSPCIDRGKNEDWMAGAVDMDGNPRIINGRVDMGAYEFGEMVAHPCDDNQDLVVDDWELLRAIDAWAKDERRNGWPQNLEDYDWALLELIDLWAPGTEYDPNSIAYW